MSYRLFIRALALLTALVYVAMMGIGYFRLMPLSGGMTPPDMWVLGYDAARIAEWLAAMDADARALYLGPIAVLDSIFPPMFGLLLACLIWRMGRGWLAMLPFAYSATDLWENSVLHRILRDEAADLADHASNLTQGKFALMAMALLLVWMVWRDRQRSRGRR